jgi:hypothetical protein
VSDDLNVDAWLTVPDCAERIGGDVRAVRRMLQDRSLIGVRQEDGIFRVPERFLVATADGTAFVPHLHGTLVLLADAGFSDTEAIRWLFTPDDSLPMPLPAQDRVPAPIDALAAGHKTEVRRRAQALAF